VALFTDCILVLERKAEDKLALKSQVMLKGTVVDTEPKFGAEFGFPQVVEKMVSRAILFTSPGKVQTVVFFKDVAEKMVWAPVCEKTVKKANS